MPDDRGYVLIEVHGDARESLPEEGSPLEPVSISTEGPDAPPGPSRSGASEVPALHDVRETGAAASSSDLDEAPMPKAQRIVIASAVAFAVIFAVYWWFSHLG